MGLFVVVAPSCRCAMTHAALYPAQVARHREAYATLALHSQGSNHQRVHLSLRQVVENSSLTDEENLEALETEISILRQLTHPHIVALKEVFESHAASSLPSAVPRTHGWARSRRLDNANIEQLSPR